MEETAADRRKRLNKESLARRLADPEYAAASKAKKRAWDKRSLNPEYVAAQRARGKAHRAKARTDEEKEIMRERNRLKNIAYRARHPGRNAASCKLYSSKTRPKARPALGTVLPALLHCDEIYAAAAKATPRSLPPYIRDDVISEIVLAVLEGRIQQKEIARRAPDFTRAYWRTFGHMATVSLDAMDDFGRSLHDKLASG